MSDVDWVVDQDESSVRVAIEGSITGETDFGTLLSSLDSQVAGKLVILDLSKVARINSAGVCAWMSFIKPVCSSARGVEFARCAPPVMHQVAILPEFVDRATVRSVLAPYFCSQCEYEHNEEVVYADGTPRPPAESMPCPRCQAQMEFDDLFEFYCG